MAANVMDEQPSFAGGLNTTSEPTALGPAQARQLSNTHLTTYGAATKRGGTRKILTAAVGTNATGNIGIYWAAATSQVCVVAGGTQLLYTATRPTSFSGAWTITADTGSTFKATSLAIFTDGTNEVLYGASQANGLYKWDGTTATHVTSGSPVSVNGICVYNERLWGWNAASYTNSVFYSDLDNGDTLGVGASGGGQIVVTHYAGAPIQYCAVVGASLLIFHTRGISRLTGFGQSDLSVSPQAATEDIAICGVHACAVYHNAAWVATPQGLYQVTEGTAIPVGTPDMPDPTIAAIAASSSPTSVMVYASVRTQEVWVWIPGTGVYAYHILLGAWSGPFDGAVFGAASPSVPFEIRDSGVARRTVLPPDTNGVMWELDSPDYYADSLSTSAASGSAYMQVLQCRRLSGQDVPGTANKVWTRADVFATLTSGATAPTLATASVFGGTSTVTMRSPTGNVEQDYYNAAGGCGPYVDVTITDSATSSATYAKVTVLGHLVGPR